MSIEVVGLGALNVDHIYQVERILDDGEAVVKRSLLAPGGSAANTIYGLARLGVIAGFAGVIGDDADGQLLIHDFQTVGVDTSRIKIKQGANTGAVVCLSDSSGKRSLYISPGANNLFSMDDLDFDYVNQATLLHLSSFADYVELTLESLNPSLKVSLAPGALYSAKGLETLAPLLERTDVLFVNQDEIRQLTGHDVAMGAETCIRQGCRTVVVTLGKGTVTKAVLESQDNEANAVAYIRDSSNEYLIEPSKGLLTTVVDTTGAGDAFATGFLYGLLTRKGLEECGRLGSIVAQFSITQIGARQGLPTLDELSQRYQELYDKEL